MIVYDLHCAHGHHFGGWFPAADEFERQRERDLVRSPRWAVP